MKGFKSHFVFNKSQRNGILFLVLLIIGLQAGYFFLDLSAEESLSPEQLEEIVLFQRQIDSLKKEAALKGKDTSFSFNPNFISDYKGYTLGMSPEEIDRLHAFRAQDKWVNSKEDFQEVTKISDSLLSAISPLFSFPEWVENSTARISSRQEYPTETREEPRDLNRATAAELREVYGVGEVLSERIVNYRESIGGFNHEIQLKDVYGLSPEVVERITNKFSVFKPVEEKQDLNSISLIDLSALPFFGYELARKIIKYRDSTGRITSFEELNELTGFPEDKLDRIKLYLDIN